MLTPSITLKHLVPIGAWRPKRESSFKLCPILYRIAGVCRMAYSHLDEAWFYDYIPIYPVLLLRGGSRSSLVAGRDAVDATGRSKAGMREKREPDDDSGPRGRREACLSRRSCPRQNMSGRPRRSGSSSRRVVVAAVSVSPANGGNPDRSPGAARRTPSLLTACGTPDVSGAFVVTCSCACFHRA